MAHFAQISETNDVLQVIVIPNEEEHQGEYFIHETLQLPGRWIQCSYNATIRGNYPGPGFKYDEDLDAFIPPKPSSDHILNETTFRWELPEEPSE